MKRVKVDSKRGSLVSLSFCKMRIVKLPLKVPKVNMERHVKCLTRCLATEKPLKKCYLPKIERDIDKYWSHPSNTSLISQTGEPRQERIRDMGQSMWSVWWIKHLQWAREKVEEGTYRICSNQRAMESERPGSESCLCHLLAVYGLWPRFSCS